MAETRHDVLTRSDLVSPADEAGLRPAPGNDTARRAAPGTEAGLRSGGTDGEHRPLAAAPADLLTLHHGYDIAHFPDTGSRLGRLLRGYLLRLLGPLLDRQLTYNAANTRLASYLWERAEALRQDLTQDRLHLERKADEASREHILALQTLGQTLGGALQEQVQSLKQQLATLRRESEEARQRQAEMLDSVRESAARQIDALGRQQLRALESLRVGLVDQVRRLGEPASLRPAVEGERSAALEPLLEMPPPRPPLAAAAQPAPVAEGALDLSPRAARASWPEEAPGELDRFYLGFEAEFRGPRDLVKERLRVYIPYVDEVLRSAADPPAFDLGCGRGEWLELLLEKGLRARGVDRNTLAVRQCRGLGLDAVQGDLLAFLRALPDEAASVVSAFHVMEHLPFEDLVAVFDETLRVLRPGGLAIFETPNPANLLVGSTTFYLDPTHKHPLPSPLLHFVAETRGLTGVKVLDLHPYPAQALLRGPDPESARKLNALLYGPQDYAVLGWKPGP